MSDAQNNVENTNTIWHLMHVTAISTSCTHGIRSGVQMPQITKYEFKESIVLNVITLNMTGNNHCPQC